MKAKLQPTCPNCAERSICLRYPCEVAEEPAFWDFQGGKWFPSADVRAQEHLHGTCLGWDHPIPSGPHICRDCGWTGDINAPGDTPMKPGRYLVVLDVSPDRKHLWDLKGLRAKLLALDCTGEKGGAAFQDVTVYNNVENLREAIQTGDLNLIDGRQRPQEG